MNSPRFRRYNIPMVKVMALKRAGSSGRPKETASDRLRPRTANPDNADPPDAEGGGNGRNGVFDPQRV
jgi:hypothetical protein